MTPLGQQAFPASPSALGAIVPLLCLGLCVPPLAAQAPSRVALFGKTGVNVATMSFSPGLDRSARLGFAVGAAVSVDLGQVTAFQGEVIFSRKGANSIASPRVVDPATLNLVETSADIALAYLEVPLLLKLGAKRRTKARPVFVLGPVLALEATCGVDLIGRFFDPQTGNLLYESRGAPHCAQVESRNGADLGFVIGGGVEIPLGEWRLLSLETRYEHGLTNLDNTGPAGQSARNQVLSVLVGFGFRMW